MSLVPTWFVWVLFAFNCALAVLAMLEITLIVWRRTLGMAAGNNPLWTLLSLGVQVASASVIWTWLHP